MLNLDTFCREARAIVGESHVVTECGVLAKLAENTLGLKRTTLAAVYPDSTGQVSALVKLARQTAVPVYPVSRGRNMGYGDRAPATDGQVLLELSRMRAIREYDDEIGLVLIESGVSQLDLHDFLRRQRAPYWMDATGAGLDASIVGNTLEGGFGHTPLGNHREAFSDAEVVLGDGRIIRSGRFPGLGPDLKGLFVQSNFGVVTAMRVPLLPEPEHFESFVLRSDQADHLPKLVDILRRLRMEAVLTSCVHIANPVRYLMSSRLCPPEFSDRVISDTDAMRIMSSRLLRVGRWNAAGGLYGSRRAVSAHKRSIVRALQGVAAVQFFSNSKLAALAFLAGKVSDGSGALKRVHESLVSFTHIHRLMQGIPTDEPFRNIFWRVDSRDKLGLIWFAPCQDAKGALAVRMMDLAAPLFARFGFEMPVTITLVSGERMVAVFNILFDRTVAKDMHRAWALYAALRETFSIEGIGPYRTSILDTHTQGQDPGRAWALGRIKAALDPDSIMAPGRYGITAVAPEA